MKLFISQTFLLLLVNILSVYFFFSQLIYSKKNYISIQLKYFIFKTVIYSSITYFFCFFSNSKNKATLIFLSRYKKSIYSKIFTRLFSKIFCRYVHIIDRYSKLRNNEDIHQTKMIFDLIKICHIPFDSNTTIDISLPRDKLNLIPLNKALITLHLSDSWINKFYTEENFLELVLKLPKNKYVYVLTTDNSTKNKFKKITRIGDLDKVINGIMVAKKAGLKIKINTVALKEINDNEILNLVNWCGENKFSLTFIEVMPMGEIGEKRSDQYMPLTEVKSLIQTKYSLTEDSLRTGGPARYVHCHETDQKIGFITPHTHNFCELCNRVRVTCTGIMYMCLGQQDKADLITPLRKSENNDLLKNVIYEAISRKPKGHDFVIDREQEEIYVPRHMNVTGG